MFIGTELDPRVFKYNKLERDRNEFSGSLFAPLSSLL